MQYLLPSLLIVLIATRLVPSEAGSDSSTTQSTVDCQGMFVSSEVGLEHLAKCKTATDVRITLEDLNITSLEVPGLESAQTLTIDFKSGSMDTIIFPNLKTIESELQLFVHEGSIESIVLPSLGQAHFVSMNVKGTVGSIKMATRSTVAISGDVKITGGERGSLEKLFIGRASHIGRLYTEGQLAIGSIDINGLHDSDRRRVTSDSLTMDDFKIYAHGTTIARVALFNVGRLSGFLKLVATAGGAVEEMVISGDGDLFIQHIYKELDSGEGVLVIDGVSKVANIHRLDGGATINGIFVSSGDRVSECDGEGVFKDDNTGCICFDGTSNCQPTEVTTTPVITTTTTATTTTTTTTATTTTTTTAGTTSTTAAIIGDSDSNVSRSTGSNAATGLSIGVAVAALVAVVALLALAMYIRKNRAGLSGNVIDPEKGQYAANPRYQYDPSFESQYEEPTNYVGPAAPPTYLEPSTAPPSEPVYQDMEDSAPHKYIDLVPNGGVDCPLYEFAEDVQAPALYDMAQAAAPDGEATYDLATMPTQTSPAVYDFATALEVSNLPDDTTYDNIIASSSEVHEDACSYITVEGHDDLAEYHH